MANRGWKEQLTGDITPHDMLQELLAIRSDLQDASQNTKGIDQEIERLERLIDSQTGGNSQEVYRRIKEAREEARRKRRGNL